MELYNTTKQTTIAEKVIIADSFLKRFKGLMLKKTLPANNALILKNCKGIHTLFMLFPIDAVFINKSGTVIYLAEYLKPWKTSKYIPNAYSIIELPSGSIDLFNIKIGDILQF